MKAACGRSGSVLGSSTVILISMSNEAPGAVLPGYDDSQWNSSSPFDGISQPGIQIYRTSFDLNIPTGLDVPLGIEFTPTLTSNYRSVLYVNGWQFGRFISNLGPQTTFPVHSFLLTSAPHLILTSRTGTRRCSEPSRN